MTITFRFNFGFKLHPELTWKKKSLLHSAFIPVMRGREHIQLKPNTDDKCNRVPE